MIFKIQRSLVPRDFTVLIYNEDRSIREMMAFSEDWSMVFGIREKMYVDAEIKEDGTFMINEFVEDQAW